MDNTSKETGKKEKKDNSKTLLSFSSSRMMTVWRVEEGRNYTRPSTDEVDHRLTRRSRTTGWGRTTNHHRPLMQYRAEEGADNTKEAEDVDGVTDVDNAGNGEEGDDDQRR